MPVVETRERIVIRDMQQVLFAFLQREQRVAERRHDRLSFLVSCIRKRHVRCTLGDLRERLLQLRQRPQARVSAESRPTIQEVKSNSHQGDARYRKSSQKRALIGREIKVDGDEAQQLDLGFNAVRISFEQPIVCE